MNRKVSKDAQLRLKENLIKYSNYKIPVFDKYLPLQGRKNYRFSMKWLMVLVCCYS
jgi:hypothetical protein